MKIIVAGTRTFDMVDLLYEKLDHIADVARIDEIVSGHARGADQMGEMYADERGIPVKLFPAEWDKYGKIAGIRRNVEMADYADELVAFWDGKSTGTKHMINTMTLKNKPLHVVLYV